MKIVKQTWMVVLMLSLAGVIGCGDSKISTFGSNKDVGFDPANSDLKVLHYTAVRQRIVAMGISTSSNSINTLNSYQNLFLKPKMTGAYKSAFFRVMNEACREADPADIFPDGTKIDKIWKITTGETAGAEAQKVEDKMLDLVSGQSDDVKQFSLCLGAAMNLRAISANL
jgi:hypothetical protein